MCTDMQKVVGRANSTALAWCQSHAWPWVVKESGQQFWDCYFKCGYRVCCWRCWFQISVSLLRGSRKSLVWAVESTLCSCVPLWLNPTQGEARFGYGFLTDIAYTSLHLQCEKPDCLVLSLRSTPLSAAGHLCSVKKAYEFGQWGISCYTWLVVLHPLTYKQLLCCSKQVVKDKQRDPPPQTQSTIRHVLLFCRQRLLRCLLALKHALNHPWNIKYTLSLVSLRKQIIKVIGK